MTRKLCNPRTSAKCYWSILNSFSNDKKIPCLPPFLHYDKFVIYFKENAKPFNSFFCGTVLRDCKC